MNEDHTNLNDDQQPSDGQGDGLAQPERRFEVPIPNWLAERILGGSHRAGSYDTATPSTAPSVKGGSRDHLVVEPAWRDPITGATYVHRDLEEAVRPWENEEYIPNPKALEQLGDVESWCTFVTRYGDQPSYAHLTWNKAGLCAILDWHGSAFNPGRCQFVGEYRFVQTRQLREWLAFANNGWLTQAVAVERLERLVDDIKVPEPASVIELLQVLKGHASSRATSQLRTDGTMGLTFESDRTLQVGAADAELPSHLLIAIPVLVGHPDLFPLKVRMRADVTGESGVRFRFEMLNLDQALEIAYGDLVAKAREALPEDYVLLRAAD